MSVFIVLLDDEQTLQEEQIESVSSQKPCKVNDKTFLITSDELTSDISEKLGMNREKNVVGAVIRLKPARSGWFSSGVWEWFNEAEERVNAQR